MSKESGNRSGVMRSVRQTDTEYGGTGERYDIWQAQSETVKR